MRTAIFVSLIPNLMGGEGHIIPYHQAVSQAVEKLGWKHLVAIPLDGKIDPIPVDWDDCLSNADLEKEGNLWQKLLRIQGTWKLGKTIASYLQTQVIPKSELSILFLERFIHLQLLALVIALFLIPNPTLSVWLLYRRDTHNDRTRFIYKFFNHLLKKRLKAGRFQLLTDSELLSQSLSNYFQESVTVMPIPHTDINGNRTNPVDKAEILCWWPGSPRQEKGWQIIETLVNTSCEISQNICLVSAKSSHLKSVKNGIQVKLIQDRITREEYNDWLSISDIILLPYDAQAYQERTSGIFTECIMAGKIPLVTPHTWMAYELLKYNLSELIIDWQDPQNTIFSMAKIAKNSPIKDKIIQMQRSYQKFHCIDNYADTMQKIFQRMTN